ncbi:MAG: DUF3014 domain-containing protein [Elusimicrobia bacterium]|nr:DUF3014 domain-containing protein [Elusimicrobiota bacterium]
MEENSPSGNKKIWIGLVFFVGVAVVSWIYFSPSLFKPALPPEPTLSPTVNVPPPATSPVPGGPTLEQSDTFIREKSESLSSNPALATWLKKDEIIRRITAAVDIIANGKLPRDTIGFLRPHKRFMVKRVGKKLYIDPKSYARYDGIANTIQSLNVPAMVRLFEMLKPVFEQTCREQGCWQNGFQARLVQATQDLLKTPLVQDNIRVRKKVSTYVMMDPTLESLSPPQKALLRMGPKNTAKVQLKLRALAKALGVPENQLPPSQPYFPVVK